MDSLQLVLMILLLPLVGGLLSYFLKSYLPAIGLGVIAVVLSAFMLVSAEVVNYRFEWLPDLVLGLRVDNLGITLVFLVCFISLLIQMFSVKYIAV